MTTYTLTVEQRGQLMTDLAKAYISSEALSMLQSLQPNTQEPVGEVQHLDELNEQWTKHLPIGTKLYTHPAPQQPAEPRVDIAFGGPKAREQMLNQLVHPAPQQVAGLLATDDFYSWWGENPSLGQQQALVQFYDKQPAQQAKPLTVQEVEQILAQHNYELHGDRARYIVRMTEQAHGVKP